jgi:hypothetical protein
MADKDIAFDRHVAKRHQAMTTLSKWLTERGITDHWLRVQVHAIDNRLGLFDDREARRFELNRMERGFWAAGCAGISDHQRDGQRAVALWRLHQQLLDHCD